MSSLLRTVKKRKKSRVLGEVEVVNREEFSGLELDSKVEMIRALIPLGLMHVEELLDPGIPLFVLCGTIQGKVTGPRPEAIDNLFTSTFADYIIVEADGARSMSIKAPADDEPVIPTASTTVIVVVGADALGQPLGTVAHRVDRITILAGLTDDVVLTPQSAASILLHPNGGLKSVPEAARVVMAVANVTAANEAAATGLAGILADHRRVDRSVTMLGPSADVRSATATRTQILRPDR